MKTPDGFAQQRKQALSAVRQSVVGILLFLPAFALWATRDFLPTLAATRVVATAVLSTLHDGTDAQLQRAFAAAQMSHPMEATLEPEVNPKVHGVAYLS